MVDAFLNEVKTAAGILTKFTLYIVGQEVPIASFSCLWRIRGMTQGLGAFFFFWVVLGVVVKVLAVWQVQVLGSESWDQSPFLYSNQNENKNI